MIIFRKKRLVLMICFLFLSFSVYFATNSSNKINTNNRNYDITQVSSIPATGKVVVIDAGHGGEDRSVLLGVNNISEASINLKIALKLQQLLEEANATVILTRSDENSIHELDSKTLREKKVSDIRNRVSIGNSSGADAFVSIHLNKIPQSQYDGWQTFYNGKSAEGKILAETIQSSLLDSTGRNNKRVAKAIDNVYIAKHVEIPLCIVECGFLSNPNEAELLTQDEYQNKLAWGIFIRNY